MEQNMNLDNEVLAYLPSRKDELMTHAAWRVHCRASQNQRSTQRLPIFGTPQQTLQRLSVSTNSKEWLRTKSSRVRSSGCFYGTASAELERIKSNGQIPIIEVDVEGAVEINRQAVESNFLFVYPPSFEVLRRRIGNRIETEQEFKVRIREAIRQIELANNSVLFTNRLVNDTIEDAKDQFITLIKALYF